MWITINLPWKCTEFPNINNPLSEFEHEWPLYTQMEFYKAQADTDNLFAKCNELVEKYENSNSVDTAREAIYNSHPEFLPVKQYRLLRAAWNDWINEHPKYKEYLQSYQEAKEVIKQKSFCGRNLNQPGTVIEIEEDGVTRILLIGDINCLGGVCDDCRDIREDAIVKRYKVLDWK